LTIAGEGEQQLDDAPAVKAAVDVIPQVTTASLA
jgi:hypothetical protein